MAVAVRQFFRQLAFVIAPRQFARQQAGALFAQAQPQRMGRHQDVHLGQRRRQIIGDDQPAGLLRVRRARLRQMTEHAGQPLHVRRGGIEFGQAGQRRHVAVQAFAPYRRLAVGQQLLALVDDDETQLLRAGCIARAVQQLQQAGQFPASIGVPHAPPT